MGSGNDEGSITGADGPVAVSSEADAVDHLYGLAPTEFVSARNELAKTARAAGERELATAVKALRKPSMLAAELNRVLRLDDERVDALLQAGLALRDGHQSVLSGGEVDVAVLQSTHREAAAEVVNPAENHRDRLQALVEAASLDVACHDDLKRAAYVTEPVPALGFDLFSPQAAPAATDGETTATVSSISQARTRKRRREAEEKAEAKSKTRAEASATATTEPSAKTKPSAEAKASAEAQRRAEAAERTALAEAETAAASSAHGKAEASLTLAYRQAEAAAKKHAKATERLSEAERQLDEARSQLTKADKSLAVARSRSEAAEETLSSTADALREARARLEAETSADQQ